jgi:UDP-glucose 4-epimerase
MDKKFVLVVGGAGFIGSHVNKMLSQAGYSTLVLDNLSTGSRQAVISGIFIEGNMADRALLDQIFTQYPVTAVMHFAALIDVGESVRDPLKYYKSNVADTLVLLEAMRDHSVDIFIFSSSAAIFGIPQHNSVTETDPSHPINPYGESKLILENLLRDCEVYGLRSCCLRYFNAAGGDPEGKIKNCQLKSTNLIPIVLANLLQPGGAVTVFGTDYPTHDGSCVRDYVHIEDLGTAHIAAMEQLMKGSPSTCYNLGNGNGYSVRQVIAAAQKITGRDLTVIEGPRRAGDPPILVANSDKAKRELRWQPRYPALEEMISHAWNAIVGSAER